MSDDDFKALVEYGLGKVLKANRFEFKEENRSGYFGNCEVLYVYEKCFVSVERERGSLGVFFGVENSDGPHSWYLDALVMFMMDQRGEKIDKRGDMFSAKGIVRNFDKEFDRYELMMNAWLGKLIELFEKEDFSKLKKQVEDYTARM